MSKNTITNSYHFSWKSRLITVVYGLSIMITCITATIMLTTITYFISHHTNAPILSAIPAGSMILVPLEAELYAKWFFASGFLMWSAVSTMKHIDNNYDIIQPSREQIIFVNNTRSDPIIIEGEYFAGRHIYVKKSAGYNIYSRCLNTIKFDYIYKTTDDFYLVILNIHFKIKPEFLTIPGIKMLSVAADRQTEQFVDFIDQIKIISHEGKLEFPAQQLANNPFGISKLMICADTIYKKIE